MNIILGWPKREITYETLPRVAMQAVLLKWGKIAVWNSMMYLTQSVQRN